VIDTHAHVHDKKFDEDRAAVIDRARVADVVTMITVGCDVTDSLRALECAREYRIYSSVGIHPHEAKDAPADIALVFESFLRDPRVVAIGEAGLDYYYDHSPRDVQRRVLREQLELAREAGFPFIFHHRDAFEDFLGILRELWEPPMRGVVHCFTGDTNQAQIFTQEFGLYLGIGGVLTFKTAEPLRSAVRAVGLRSLVLETDCPYLAPSPHRGERNEPAYVALTAGRLAEVLECGVDEVVATTDANARNLFSLKAN
jgi:TatD DNase family protein